MKAVEEQIQKRAVVCVVFAAQRLLPNLTGDYVGICNSFMGLFPMLTLITQDSVKNVPDFYDFHFLCYFQFPNYYKMDLVVSYFFQSKMEYTLTRPGNQ